MKFLKNAPYFLLATFLLFSACRTEDEEIITPPEQQSLEANSNAANLITRVSTNDGSNDNILDNANCINIQLPVTVIIDDLEIIVNSEEDFDTIEDIFDEFINDIDELDFVFPITIILSDFTEVTIANEEELIALVEECSGENEVDEDIECIDFQYPITYSIFDQNNELIETVTISNDQEHYEFIENLDDTDIITINFPLTLILSDGNTVTVTNILDLEEVIEDAIDDCDEDDDNDIDDDDCEDCTNDTLVDALESCDNGFVVDEFIIGDIDNTEQYEDYVFEFNPNGVVIVETNGEVFEGTWSFDGEGNDSTIEISIPGLDDFNDVWEVIEIENEDEEVEITITNGNDYIVFECDDEDDGNDDFDCPDLEANIGDACESQNGNNGIINENCECEEEDDVTFLEGVLTAENSVWFVSSYTEDNNDETAIFNGFEFEFNIDGTATANNSGTITNGTWAHINNETELLLNFGTSSPLDELEDDWDIISVTETQVELQDVSGGNGGTDTLILTRL
ncbi:hypothetical protein GCM10011344_03820 [Dokdonia pacifica]|uniref:Lipocalin-like domain-containing protein n=1 Tax=Dokdonia pacifica TaxID=1627892 RepID=A0A238ZJK2_9FLAO|nr:hypothetical protein [Dokdonia pacifica]GGG06593.1 hypothetical protein GCM10011344_03820 [Dokdonia pacifica]SNR82874.1 hypothetical protein SAMN06265376_103243 [Dokdonia pacifica]